MWSILGAKQIPGLVEFSDLIHKQGETLERVARHIGIDPALFPRPRPNTAHKSVGEGKSHVKFDDPPAWARLLKKATPSRYREKVPRVSRNKSAPSRKSL